MRERETQSFYLPELDLVRAGAFFAVFVSHWVPKSYDYYVRHGLSPHLARTAIAVSDAGASGVMLFFCLSSYLITRLLLVELETRGRIDVPKFYMRRALRIWPLYLAFTLIAAFMPFVDAQQHFGPKVLVAFLLFAGNWVWALRVPVETIALPLWSISVEEQFYLVWPWLVRRASRPGLRNIAIGLLVVAALNRVLVVAGVFHVDLWHNTFTQLDAIGLGALLALGVGERIEAMKVRMRGVLVAFALFAVYMASCIYNPDADTAPASLVFYPVVALAHAVVLFAVVGSRVDLRSPRVRAAIYVGKISYGLYVVHYACLKLAAWVLHQVPVKLNFAVTFLLTGTLALGFALVLATLSYRFLEAPVLRLKSRFEWARRGSPGSAA